MVIFVLGLVERAFKSAAAFRVDRTHFEVERAAVGMTIGLENAGNCLVLVPPRAHERIDPGSRCSHEHENWRIGISRAGPD